MDIRKEYATSYGVKEYDVHLIPRGYCLEVWINDVLVSTFIDGVENKEG